MRFLLLIPCAIFVLIISGCEESYEDKLKKFEATVKENRFGEASDYWLAKKSIFGTIDKMALIFGMLNDGDMCFELAELYSNKYPGTKYVCIPAN